MRELDLFKDFSKLWTFKGLYKEIRKEDYVGFMDNSNVLMVIPKIESIKKIIEDNFDVMNIRNKDSLDKMLTLNYKVDMIDNPDKGKVYARLVGEKIEEAENSCRYTPELLKILLKMCIHTKSKDILIKFRKDYPLWLETDELICILAPRVEDD